MNISTRHLFLSAGIAFFLAFTFATFAQDTKQADPASAEPTAGKPAVNSPTVNAPAEQPASSATVAPAPAPASDEQAATPAAAPDDTKHEEVAPAEETANPATTPAEGTPAATVLPAPDSENHEAPKLRRLDSDENPPARKTHKELIHERIERAKQRAAERRANAVGRDIVNVFSNSELPKGEKADSVVAIFGSATAEGDVTDAVVSVSAPARWYYRGTAPMRKLHWLVTRPEGRLVGRYGFRTRIHHREWDPVPLSPVEAVPRIAPTPLLIVHGDRDGYFPLDHPRMLADAAGDRGELWLEPGMGHAEHAATDALLARIGTWGAAQAG